MEEPNSSKKPKRKIRCTQEFNQLQRKSLGITTYKGTSSTKKTSKKNNDFFYLPKLDVDSAIKENFSPNISEKEISKKKTVKSKNKSSKDNNDFFYLPKLDMDSAIKENFSPNISEKEISKKKTVKSKNKSSKEIGNSDIKDRQSKENNGTFADGERKDSTEIQFKKRRKKKKHLNFEEQLNTSNHEDFLNIKTEGNCTTKCSERQNAIDTYEIIKIESPRSTTKTFNNNTAKTSILSDLASPVNISTHSNTFELQNSTFDVSQLPVITSTKKDLSSLKDSQNRRSRSVEKEKTMTRNCINVNNKKSVNFMKSEESKRSRSLSRFSSKMNITSDCNRKSVRFTECKNNKESPKSEPNNSMKYRKSPYIRKSSVSSKNQNCSPELNNSCQTQNLLGISPSGTSTSFNETFEIISPTKSYSTITKRKQWNRSLGVSILDSSGLLHTISPPWEIKECGNSFSFGNGSNSSSEKNNIFDLNCQRTPSSQKNSNFSTKNISSTEKEKTPVIENCAKQSKLSQSQGKVTKWINSPIKRATEIDTNKASTNKLTKMPNFALIHQKAYDKLENLKDMTERKAARTQLLLSGKNPNKLQVKSPKFKIKSPKSKRLLRFNPSRKSLENVEPQAAPSPFKTITRDVAPSTSNPKFITEKHLNKNVKSNIPKFTRKPLVDQKKAVAKLGAEGKKILKQDQIKTIVNKSKPVRNSIETRRNTVQNVRTNRRFELLMRMRKGKE